MFFILKMTITPISGSCFYYRVCAIKYPSLLHRKKEGCDHAEQILQLQTFKISKPV